MAHLAKAITQLGAEVRLLAPLLLDDLPPRQLAAEPAQAVHARELRLGQRVVVLIANISQQRVKATIHFDKGVSGRRVRAMFEQRDVALAGPIFQDDLAPLSARAYEVAK
jgi:hypothetical protein